MNLAARNLWWILVIALFNAPAWAFAEITTTSTPTNPALPEVGFSVLRVIGALALVFAVFFGALWLIRNWQRFAGGKVRNPKLAVLEVKSLGNRQALYVVAYEKQRMLLASSTSGVNLVSHLPEAEGEEPEAPATTFAASLQQILSRKP